jgi:site-specific recombinase XerD
MTDTGISPRKMVRIPAFQEDAMQISALASQYLRFIAARGASPKTVECYDLTYRQFVGLLMEQRQENDLRNFTPENIEAFIDHLNANGRKASSINVKLAGLASLGEYGTKTKDGRGKYFLAENPLDRVYRPKREKPAEKYLGLVELKQFLANHKPATCQVTIEMVIDTQCRSSELSGASVEHLRIDGDRVILSVKVKGGRFKEITLGADVAAKLVETLRFREARPTDPLLVNERGDRYTRTTLSEMVLRQAQRAGITRIPVRAHVLRHSVATLASELGVDVPAIAGMLNHSDLNTVQKYVHRNAGADAARETVRAALR